MHVDSKLRIFRLKLTKTANSLHTAFKLRHQVLSLLNHAVNERSLHRIQSHHEQYQVLKIVRVR